MNFWIRWYDHETVRSLEGYNGTKIIHQAGAHQEVERSLSDALVEVSTIEG